MHDGCDVPLEKIMLNVHRLSGVCFLGDINRYVASLQE